MIAKTIIHPFILPFIIYSSSMFFFFSKVLMFLLSPAFWIGLFLTWSFITKKEKRKKILRIISLVLFIIFTNPYLFNVCVVAWEPEPVELPTNQQYSAAILLSGITGSDKYGRSYFGPEADRFIQTTKLYRSGVVKYIALSGGSGSLTQKGPMEADYLRQQMHLQGIPDSVILVDNKSRNTYENAVFTKKIFDSLHIPPPYILVTSAVHVPRAKASFAKAGMEVAIFPAAYKQIPTNKNIGDYFIPSTNLLFEWTPFLKEVVGIMVYRLSGKA